MTELKDMTDAELIGMICGIFSRDNPFTSVEAVREEILSRFPSKGKVGKVRKIRKAKCSWADFCENKDCPHIVEHEPVNVYCGKLCTGLLECAYKNYQEVYCEPVKETNE